MKLTTIILFAICLQASANGFGQNISISEKNITLEKLFKTIQNTTEYSFWCKQKVLKKALNFDVNLKNASITEVMDVALKDQPLQYIVVDKMVIVKLKDSQGPVNVQNIDISGTVKDEKGIGLPGVSIRVKGETIGTVTNELGQFVLKGVSERATLVISSVGMVTQEIPVANQTNLNVILKEHASELDNIVVVGYGTQKRKDLTGAISTISSADLKDRPGTNFASSIEGKAAGVQVIKSSGQPQAGISIRIRGTSTITAGSEPLYILDGIPTTSINEINPNDIESFTVLKDASSAAIYGASGANGVVLITTKRGSNQKTKIEFSTYGGASKIWKNISALDASQYKDLVADLGLTLDANLYNANTNWQDEILRTGKMQNYQLSLTGGTEKTTYYMSGSYLSTDGVVITNTLDRTNFKLNFDHQANSFIKVGANISYNRSGDVSVSENDINGSIMSLLVGSPVIGIYEANGRFTTNPLLTNLENPVALIRGAVPKYTQYRFNSNVFAELTFLPSLKLKSTFGFDQSSDEYSSFRDPFISFEGRRQNGVADQSNSGSRFWLSENILNFNKTYNKHTVSALGGIVISKLQTSSLYLATKGFANIGAPSVNNGAEVVSRSASFGERKNISAISRINYSFEDKYLLTGNFRADASSVFGPSNRWGYFPSASAGWRISKEPFFKDVTFISDLKLRAGWGIVGNDQIPAYGQFGLINPSGSYPIGGVLVPGILPITLENKDLKWETTDQLNIGLDVAILNSRVTLSTDYYVKKTKDLLFNRPIPTSTGLGVVTGSGATATALQNIGSLQNKGVEFQVSSKNLVDKVKWTTDFNISFNRNKVLNIEGDSLLIANILSRGSISKVKGGLPLGTFVGLISEGVDPATGDMVYRDIDGDGEVSEGDKTIIGNANPKFTFGITNNFNYKNWGLNIFIQGVQGNDVFNATRITSEGMVDGRNQSTAVLNRWKSPGQVTDIPRAIYGNTSNSLVSDRFVENGSYLRFKSVSLNYSFPDKALSKLKLANLRLYVTGENLITFTKYSGFDPEVSAYGASNTAFGVDYGTYPQTRSIIFGLNVGF